jgi:TPR repeat protein
VRIALRIFAFAALSFIALALPVWAQDLDPAKKAFMLGDYATAKKLWLEGAQAGDPEAMNNLGILYNKGLGVDQDIATAVQLYTRAANLGYPNAQFNLANLYYDGNGIKRDLREAARWYAAAAQGGHTLSQFYLAEMYASGEGVKKNETEALRWYAAAAEGKLPQSEYELGRRLLFGDGVKADHDKAYGYLMDAGFQGHAPSQALLGRAYAKAIGGGEARPVEAFVWLTMASRRLKPGKDLKNVTEMLRSVEGQLSPDEHAAALATLEQFERQTPGGVEVQ